jgi:hypothetical protein
MTTQRMTPDMMELTTYAQIEEGDTLVNFTPIGRDVTTPPTQAQLSRLRADRVLVVDGISSPRSGVLDLGTGPNRWTGLATASVWRIKH